MIAVRLDFSSALDPTTLVPGGTVHLTFNPTGDFGGASDLDVPLTGVNLSTDGTEVQLLPAAPLAPGYYRVGITASDANGLPIDTTATFQVAGIEGGSSHATAGNDTFQTAISVGDLTGTALKQVRGTIGDDPAYDPANRTRIWPIPPPMSICTISGSPAQGVTHSSRRCSPVESARPSIPPLACSGSTPQATPR